MEKQRRKFRVSFGTGIDKVKHLEEKDLNNSRATPRLELAPRAEILDCPQDGSASGQGVFKVAAKKRQEIVSQPSLSTSNARGITLLLQETLMRPRFDNSVVLISKRRVVVLWRRRKNN